MTPNETEMLTLKFRKRNLEERKSSLCRQVSELDGFLNDINKRMQEIREDEMVKEKEGVKA